VPCPTLRRTKRAVIAPNILIIGPDGEGLEDIRRALISLGYESSITGDVEKARALVKSGGSAVIFADMGWLSERGSGLLRSTQNTDADAAVIVLADDTTIEGAVDALRNGARCCLLKPFTLSHLRLTLEQALAASPIIGQPPGGPQQPRKLSGELIVGASQAIQRVLDLAARAARSDTNVIIFGESGTGKELFARTIHACSKRSQGVFVPVDCASLPETLLEAELFGYEKGAFTGAVRTKPGVMELAHGGTLFFDEIAELPMSLQPKLLRALQERRHRRLGGTRMVDFDVRVISATNRNLRQLVADGRFREDLFYRLNVVPLRLPPLRTRDTDIVLLARHFLTECARRGLSDTKSFAPEVLRVLEDYAWPGNVRELQNVVEYSCALATTGTITLRDLPEELRLYDPKAPEILPESPVLTFKVAKTRWLTQFESGYVADLLKRYGDNVTQAAKAAGIDRKTLYSLLRKHHVQPSPERHLPPRLRAL
jgi:two-component system, NtrC family, response regulator AtoC